MLPGFSLPPDIPPGPQVVVIEPSTLIQGTIMDNSPEKIIRNIE